ncbi:transposase [Aerosakkonemataceae cyanobacterium BLCC-F50]|uniref:Transposase n=1 Tax=Floridaenema flaviceps BLCC-F50 TaxID=3153642 RepID=A0ABV4XI13_9CYAN
MPNYRRLFVPGGTYFFTIVTYQRYPWLCSDIGRTALRNAFIYVKQRYPFSIEAIVLLPEHFHCILSLPEGDKDYANRWRLIKRFVTKRYANQLGIDLEISQSREKRHESNLWQRRYWEHLIRDETDFANHCNYIHYNPVKHGLCNSAQDWEFSSYHRFVSQGIYPKDWGVSQSPNIPCDVGYE